MGYVNKSEIEESLYNIIKEKLNFKSDQEIDSYIKKLINWLVEDMYLIMNSKKPVDTYTKEEFDIIINEIKPTIIDIADYYTKMDINKIINDLVKRLGEKMSLNTNYPSNEDIKSLIKRISEIDVEPIDSYTKEEFNNKYNSDYSKDNMDNQYIDNSVVSVKKANELYNSLEKYMNMYKSHLNDICRALTYVGINTIQNSSLDTILENIPKALEIVPIGNDPDIEISINKLVDNLSIQKLCIDDDSNIYIDNANIISILNSQGIYKKSIEKINKIESDIFDYFSYTNNEKNAKCIVIYGDNKLSMYVISINNNDIDNIYYDEAHSDIISKGKSISYDSHIPLGNKYGLLCKDKSNNKYILVDNVSIGENNNIILDGKSLSLTVPSSVYKGSKGIYRPILFKGNTVYVIGYDETDTHYNFVIDGCSNIIAIEPVSNYIFIVYDNKIAIFDMIFKEITNIVYSNSSNFKCAACSSDRIYAVDDENNVIIYDAYYENNSVKAKIDDNIIGIYYDKKLNRALAYSQTSIYVVS